MDGSDDDDEDDGEKEGEEGGDGIYACTRVHVTLDSD